MTIDELEELKHTESLATRGPWYVRILDDEMCVSAIAVSTKPDTHAGEDMRSGRWPGQEIVAACLIVNPPYAVIDDDRHETNADLICAMRNALPELLSLAEMGLKLENEKR